MKTLYIECAMGAAGDMLMAALCELLERPEDFTRKMNSLGLPGVRVSKTNSLKCGISGTHIDVVINGAQEGESEHNVNHGHHHENEHRHTHEDDEHNHGHSHEHGQAHIHIHENTEHAHSSLDSIIHIINALPLSAAVRENAAAVYRLIAEAEAAVHGRPVSQVHFHEVGMMDAIADIVGVCLLIELIGPDKIIASPVNLGGGTVNCAHGILPVPAPATALLLKGVPAYAGNIRTELCTPTGAALLKHFASDFSAMPLMATEKIGYGMGKKDFEAANCVRVFFGEETNSAGELNQSGGNGKVAELVCNLDDMTGEEIGFAAEILFDSGALDVFTAPIFMKKNRPAVLLTCICNPEDSERLSALILKHTTTFGLRMRICERFTLDRSFSSVNADGVEVRKKTGRGFGIEKSKWEYEDAARLAREKGLSLGEVRRRLDAETAGV